MASLPSSVSTAPFACYPQQGGSSGNSPGKIEVEHGKHEQRDDVSQLELSSKLDALFGEIRSLTGRVDTLTVLLTERKEAFDKLEDKAASLETRARALEAHQSRLSPENVDTRLRALEAGLVQTRTVGSIAIFVVPVILTFLGLVIGTWISLRQIDSAFDERNVPHSHPNSNSQSKP